MLFRNCKRALLSLAIVSLLGSAAIGADAQARDRTERSSKGKQENMYPNATREEPKAKGATKLQTKLQKLIDAYNKDDYATTRTQAEELLANPAATDYDKAVAAQL
ncbi:MAG: hypothetical protein ABWY94_02580, partial [Pseudoxanthomonas sp.]